VATLAPGVAVVFPVVVAALVLFVAERVPVDVTAIGVMVALMLVEPVTAWLAAGRCSPRRSG